MTYRHKYHTICLDIYIYLYTVRKLSKVEFRHMETKRSTPLCPVRLVVGNIPQVVFLGLVARAG